VKFQSLQTDTNTNTHKPKTLFYIYSQNTMQAICNFLRSSTAILQGVALSQAVSHRPLT